MNFSEAALSPFGVQTQGPTIRDFPEEARSFLQSQGSPRVYRRGERVQTHMQAPRAASWLQQGRLMAVVHHPDGTEQHQGWVMPDELFGVFNQLLPDCPARSNLVVDTAQAQVLHFSRDALLDMMRRFPEARWGVLVGLSRRIAQFYDVIEVSGPGPLESKLRTVLVWWSNQYGVPARDGSVELWITQNELSNAAGASRQRVQMALKAMRDGGELDVAYRKIILRPLFFELLEKARA